jgi:hypothetical protein
MKQDKMGGACSTHGSDKRSINNFFRKTLRENAT